MQGRELGLPGPFLHLGGWAVSRVHRFQNSGCPGAGWEAASGTLSLQGDNLGLIQTNLLWAVGPLTDLMRPVRGGTAWPVGSSLRLGGIFPLLWRKHEGCSSGGPKVGPQVGAEGGAA